MSDHRPGNSTPLSSTNESLDKKRWDRKKKRNEDTGERIEDVGDAIHTLVCEILCHHVDYIIMSVSRFVKRYY
jgi:predicted dinucleotide-utilizing enzyme